MLKYVSQLVASPQFEMAFGACIFLNTIVMAMQSQFAGLHSGFTIGYYAGAELGPAQAAWPWADMFFILTEYFFGILFTCEVLVKMVGMRRRFIKEYWNWIDSVIVGAWLITTVGEGMMLPVNPMLLRLARLIRLLRLLRLVKTIQGFDSLYLMTTAIKGSMSILVWAVVLLAIVQMILSLLLQQMLEGYILDESVPEEERQEVYRYYGSFARTMLTMFEITLGNWMPPCRALVEHVSEFYMIFALLHKLIIGFSVVSVITGVFIQETFKVSTMDDTIMMIQKERATKLHAQKMKVLFDQADKDGDKHLDREELHKVLGDASMKTWLGAMGLDVNDANLLFNLIDDGDEQITFDELLKGIARLKGPARSIDLLTLLDENRSQEDILRKGQQREMDVLSSENRRCLGLVFVLDGKIDNLTAELARRGQVDYEL